MPTATISPWNKEHALSSLSFPLHFIDSSFRKMAEYLLDAKGSVP
jgi:hypothetical protein